MTSAGGGRRGRPLALLVACLLLVGCTPAAAPRGAPAVPVPRLDWPTFRGDLARDGHPSGATLTAAAAARLRMAWSVDLGEEVVGSPAVAGGVVVIGTLGGSLVALNTRLGAEVWRVKGLGPLVGSPSITAGKVVVGSSDSHLYAFDLENGTRVWDWRAPGDRPALWGGVAVFKGLLVVGLGAQLGMVPAQAGTLVALDPASGDQVWSSCMRAGCGVGDALTSAPAIDATGHLFVGLGAPDDALLAADVGIGRTAWQTQLYLDLERGLDVASTPVVLNLAGAEAVGVGGASGLFALFDAATGRLRWSRQVAVGSRGDGVAGSAGSDGDALFIPSAGTPAGIVALSAFDGHTIWEYRTAEPVFASPAVGAGILVVGTGSRFGSPARGTLVALSTRDGRLLWSVETGAAGLSSPAIVGESVYAADRTGVLSAFRPGP